MLRRIYKKREQQLQEWQITIKTKTVCHVYSQWHEQHWTSNIMRWHAGLQLKRPPSGKDAGRGYSGGWRKHYWAWRLDSTNHSLTWAKSQLLRVKVYSSVKWERQVETEWPLQIEGIWILSTSRSEYCQSMNNTELNSLSSKMMITSNCRRLLQKLSEVLLIVPSLRKV